MCIGGASSDWFGQPAGGVAFLTSFNFSSDTPCYVFTDDLANGNPKAVAEATSHEVGHALGLNHDGRTSPSEPYFEGHGSGPTGWAPIMGVGYYQEVVQWSRGDYAAPDNTEDAATAMAAGLILNDDVAAPGDATLAVVFPRHALERDFRPDRHGKRHRRDPQRRRHSRPPLRRHVGRGLTLGGRREPAGRAAESVAAEAACGDVTRWPSGRRTSRTPPGEPLLR